LHICMSEHYEKEEKGDEEGKAERNNLKKAKK
jgi:hypothetical protein